MTPFLWASAQIVFHSSWSAPLVLLALAGAVAASLWLNRPTRRALGRWALLPLAAESLCATLLVLWMVNPRLRYEKRTAGENALAVAIDRSPSMATPDAPGRKSRYAAARDLVFASDNALLGRLGELGRVRTYTFGAKLAEQAPGNFPPRVEPVGGGTDLAGAIESLGAQARAQKMQAVVLLGDGIHTESGDPVAAARQAGVPIYTVGLGQSETGGGDWRNIGIDEVGVPTRVTVNQEIEMKVSLHQEGFTDSSVPLEVRLGDDVVARQPVPLSRTGRLEARLKVTPGRKGTLTYTVAVAHLPGDGLKEDDAQNVTVLASDARLKVLYVEGTLRWIYKFVRRVLEREQSIQADCVICTGGGKLLQQGTGTLNLKGGLPADLAGMQKYDVIVLGDFPRALLEESGLKLLDQYVKEKKGGVMVIGGPLALNSGDFASSALASLLPATLNGPGVPPPALAEALAPSLTSLGRVSVVLKGLEGYFPKLSLRRIWGVAGPKPGAEVWLEAGGRPLLLAQRYGEGRTMLLASDDLWAGALRETVRVESSPSGRFWIQALLWLAQRDGKSREDDPLLLARCDKSYYEPGQTVLIQTQLRKPAREETPWGTVKGEVRAGGTVVGSLALPAPDVQGRASMEWTPPGDGVYTLVLGGSQGEVKEDVECHFTVGRPFRELEHRGLDEDLLREVARASGGAYFSLQGAGGIAEAMQLGQLRASRIVEKDLLDSPLFFVTFCILAAADWFVRRKKSLI